MKVPSLLKLKLSSHPHDKEYAMSESEIEDNDLEFEYEYEDDEDDYDEDDYGAVEFESNDELELEDDEEFIDGTPLTEKKLSLKFKQHTTTDLLEKMSELAKNYSEILGLSQDQVITLLQYYSWNNEKLMDDYMDDPERVQEKSGLVTSSSASSTLKHYNDGDFMCPICCDDANETYQLACTHEFCLGCYNRYIEDKLLTGRVITCPSCDLSLNPNDIDKISGKGWSQTLLESSIREYVERQKNFKWCPSPDCNNAVEILNSNDLPNLVAKNHIPVATCEHGHQFCVYCTFENHTPAPCIVTKGWVTKCKDDSETVKWIAGNTKQCPQCESSIEKNGGCNHMTCKKCRHEFCWICMGPWIKHGNSYYQCNRYDDKKANGEVDNEQIRDKARTSLQRYIHYYNLFKIHEQSTRQDQKRCSEVEDLVLNLQESSGISWIEAQFVTDSATNLSRARSVLKWSYAVAYSCEDRSFLDIFENIQAGLAGAVEDLSKLFEIEDPQEIVKAKLDFLNKQRFLIDRQNAMVSCSREAVDKGYLNEKMD